MPYDCQPSGRPRSIDHKGEERRRVDAHQLTAPSVEVDGSSARPAFSFLVPAYRTEDFIAETIESVLAQTIPHWELVVVDNGNSDRMAEIVQPYADRDPRVRLVRQENRGYAGGMNAAADASRGRFLVPLCSDDLVAPEYCERMLGAFDRQPHAHAISPDAEMFRDEDGHVLSETFVEHSGVPRRRVPRGDLQLADIMRQQFLYYGAAIRRETWTALGGHNHGTTLVEDLDLWLRLVSGGYAVRAIPDVLGALPPARRVALPLPRERRHVRRRGRGVLQAGRAALWPARGPRRARDRGRPPAPRSSAAPDALQHPG